MLLNYIIWNIKPQLLDFGRFEIRYYSLLFAFGFIAGYFILLKIFKKQGLKVELLDKLTIYMVISTIIGARVGHCFFYEFDYYKHHLLEIILPWRGQLGKDFRFTGYQGLASHGAAIGILIGLILFSRKTKSAYLWTLDMVVIVTALAGCFIRVGNLMNSEIYGSPTKSNYGIVFTQDLTRELKGNYEGIIENIQYEKINDTSLNVSKGVPMQVNIGFNRRIKEVNKVKDFGKFFLTKDFDHYKFDDNVFLLSRDTANYRVANHGGRLWLEAKIGGMPRHPSQIYEAASYLFIFLLLISIYSVYEKRLKDGFIFGVFLVTLFMARFLIEFLKANQESFESSMMFNMGQLLSLPFIVAGIFLIIYKWPKKTADA
jgi:phosphatidylglycerol---prolipoprotein diacylglyceryl transferase